MVSEAMIAWLNLLADYTLTSLNAMATLRFLVAFKRYKNKPRTQVSQLRYHHLDSLNLRFSTRPQLSTLDFGQIPLRTLDKGL